MKAPLSNFKIILHFLAAAVLIVIILPRKNQLTYEVYKGKHWMSESLIAPFDFPIYKTDDELATDRSEVESSYKPYFRINPQVGQQELKLLITTLDSHHDDLNNDATKLIISELNKLYKKGIWQKSELKANFAERSTLIVSIIDDNISEDYPASSIYTPESAYNHILSVLKTEDFIRNQHVRKSIERLNIKNFIKPNLSYDESTTLQVKNSELANIPITKGVVSKGAILIKKGEIVTPLTYQILESLRKESEQYTGYSGNTFLMILGQSLLVLLCLGSILVFLSIFRGNVLYKRSNIIFILVLIVIFVYTSVMVVNAGIKVYILPLAIIPIYISTFFYARLALFVHWVVLLLVGFYVPNSFEFIFLNFTAGVASIISFKTMYRRGKLFIAVGLILAAYLLSYVAIKLIQEHSLDAISLESMLYFVANSLFILTAYQLVYVIEKIFGFLSNNTLMELCDTNRKLLRALAETTPGTFQHSMQVANLAESVIREIGGNPLLVRCGALYHDIGKTENAGFFIENQTANFNPHDKLQPEQSARIIIKHVNDGVAIAKKNNLPSQVVDFIRTHHATSSTYYFLSKFQEAHPDETNFADFTYPGPNPYNKETAVVMMADSVEAASRTLNPITPETIDALVERIVERQLRSGFFNDVNITFKELQKAKKIFKKKLENIYHTRIEYPEESKPNS